jgi:hypothetical protein
LYNVTDTEKVRRLGELEAGKAASRKYKQSPVEAVITQTKFNLAVTGKRKMLEVEPVQRPDRKADLRAKVQSKKAKGLATAKPAGMAKAKDRTKAKPKPNTESDSDSHSEAPPKNFKPTMVTLT